MHPGPARRPGRRAGPAAPCRLPWPQRARWPALPRAAWQRRAPRPGPPRAAWRIRPPRAAPRPAACRGPPTRPPRSSAGPARRPGGQGERRRAADRARRPGRRAGPVDDRAGRVRGAQRSGARRSAGWPPPPRSARQTWPPRDAAEQCEAALASAQHAIVGLQLGGHVLLPILWKTLCQPPCLESGGGSWHEVICCGAEKHMPT